LLDHGPEAALRQLKLFLVSLPLGDINRDTDHVQWLAALVSNRLPASHEPTDIPLVVDDPEFNPIIDALA
jgi:hypothetical protein